VIARYPNLVGFIPPLQLLRGAGNDAVNPFQKAGVSEFLTNRFGELCSSSCNSEVDVPRCQKIKGLENPGQKSGRGLFMLSELLSKDTFQGDPLLRAFDPPEKVIAFMMSCKDLFRELLKLEAIKNTEDLPKKIVVLVVDEGSIKIKND
jgi:hypothetical protein